jgi:hypothetical protein
VQPAKAITQAAATVALSVVENVINSPLGLLIHSFRNIRSVLAHNESKSSSAGLECVATQSYMKPKSSVDCN